MACALMWFLEEYQPSYHWHFWPAKLASCRM
jgi:hypothetical protein